jgi:hypothetical protein
MTDKAISPLRQRMIEDMTVGEPPLRIETSLTTEVVPQRYSGKR